MTSVGEGTFRRGYAPGVYDLFHIGHLNILKHASSLCHELVAGVVSDEMAELAKGRRPVVPACERLEIVRSVRFVDRAVEEHVADKMLMWKDLDFDAIFKGDDWQDTDKGRALEDKFHEVGVRVVYLPYTAHTSSTRLREVIDRMLSS